LTTATSRAALRDARQAQTYDDLLLIPLFVLDFLCIYPFADGNGRMSRLLTLLLHS
jgi:Fic family protein